MQIAHTNQKRLRESTLNALHVANVCNRLQLPTAEGIYLIPYSEICMCTAESNYSKVLLVSGEEVIVAKTLKHICSQLPSSLFIRVHQKHMVNRNKVRLIAAGHIKLESGNVVPVSRSRRSEVRASLLGNK